MPTSRSISSGLKPGLCVMTSTSGGVGSGYASTLSFSSRMDAHRDQREHRGDHQQAVVQTPHNDETDHESRSLRREFRGRDRNEGRPEGRPGISPSRVIGGSRRRSGARRLNSARGSSNTEEGEIRPTRSRHRPGSRPGRSRARRTGSTPSRRAGPSRSRRLPRCRTRPDRPSTRGPRIARCQPTCGRSRAIAASCPWIEAGPSRSTPAALPHPTAGGRPPIGPRDQGEDDHPHQCSSRKTVSSRNSRSDHRVTKPPNLTHKIGRNNSKSRNRFRRPVGWRSGPADPPTLGAALRVLKTGRQG